jgi:hypothetical protein
MKITSITLIFTLLSVLAIFFTLKSLKKDLMGIRSALVWLFLWIGIGFFSLFPSLLNSMMYFAQMESRMFFILVIAVFILFALSFNLSSKMEKMQRTASKLVQEMAIIRKQIEDKLEKEGDD